METLKKVLRAVGVVISLLCIVWFLLPLKRNTFARGSAFGIFVCLFALFLLVFYKRLSQRGKGWKSFMRTCLGVFCAGMLWVGYLTVLMNSYEKTEPPENTNIIVLGAQIFSEDHVSISMRGRLEKAQAYLEENEAAIAFVTGGQGSTEPIPEALAEKKWLEKAGVDPERIIMEDKSSNTRQNISNTLEIAEKLDIEPEYGIVTQNFHMFRALKLAEEMGIKAYPVVAETDFYLFPSYYGMEMLSLTKWHFEAIFMRG